MANVRILWVPKNDVVYLEFSAADDINQGGEPEPQPRFCPAGPTSTTIEPPRTIEHAPIGKPNIQPVAPPLIPGSRIDPPTGRRGKATGIVNSRRLRADASLALFQARIEKLARSEARLYRMGVFARRLQAAGIRQVRAVALC